MGKAESYNCPDDFDDEDIEYAGWLVSEGAVVEMMGTIIAWVDEEGRRRWRFYLATSSVPVTSVLGLLEFAKLDTIARSETGLPISYDDV